MWQGRHNTGTIASVIITGTRTTMDHAFGQRLGISQDLKWTSSSNNCPLDPLFAILLPCATAFHQWPQ